MAFIIEGLDARIKTDPTCALHTARIVCSGYEEKYAPTFVTCFLSQRLVTHEEMKLLQEQSTGKHKVLRVLKHEKWAALVQFHIGNLSDECVAAMALVSKHYSRLSEKALARMVERLKAEGKEEKPD